MEWKNFLHQQRQLFLGTSASLLLLGAGIMVPATNVSAAEKVLIKVSVFRASVPVSDMKNFAETGEVSASLRDIFNATKQDPEVTRNALTEEVAVDFLLLDRALNHPFGEALLDELGKVVHTRADSANRQALRSAIILSATEDKKISLLEVIQNYPSPEVQVEGDRLIEAAAQLRRFSDVLQVILQHWPNIFP
ncbi:alpha/beta hydrolase [Microcoleus sp. FACHB-672]|uniref:alpha/beta hydrolase n=1 Tax=Microcoleus sp. FACHB-672 TaxID=2692825 RepID=UPI0016899261|nr:alpha/beta hydrolase [Microcoleus sp. FACHB-672]MBD2039492.1 alpha/beta hydrolase [Microcoleus sp. FACHB-672]